MKNFFSNSIFETLKKSIPLFLLTLLILPASAQVTLYLDYPEADRINRGFLTKSNASTELNSNYDTLDAVVNRTKFAGVRLLSLDGFSEYRAPFTAYEEGQFVEGPPYLSGLSMSIDSMFTLLGHENVSGLPDTIIFNVHQLDPAGNFSDTEPLLWTDSLFTDSALTGSYLTVITFSIPVGIQVPAGKKAGLSIGYRGDKRDKLGIGLSYIRNPSTNKIMRSAYPYSVLKIAGFRNNDYVNMANLYSGVDTVSGDTSYFEFQNWYIWANVTYNADGINEQNTIPFELNQNSPNPFSDYTTIKYALTYPQEVSLVIYSLSGNQISRKSLGYKTGGNYQTEFTTDDLASGAYFYRIEGSNSFSKTQKMIVVK
jgi:hypothetical protein